MKWVGLTGGIACGKSSVVRLIQSLGIPVIDADKIVHELVRPEGEAFGPVVSHFGEQFLNADRTINRKSLGQRVFQNKAELKALEEILHPLVRKKVLVLREKLEKEGHGLVFYDVPLLFEKNLKSEFDSVVVVTTTPEQQRKRLKERDQLTEADIQNLLNQQLPLREKERLADYLIRNVGSPEDLKIETEKMVRFYKKT